MTRSFRLGILALLAVVASQLQAQQPPPERPLTIYPPAGLPVIPVMEGWYDNGDGTFTYSLGYSNLNEDVVELPLGEANFIEPSQFDGMQSVFFLVIPVEKLLHCIFYLEEMRWLMLATGDSHVDRTVSACIFIINIL